MHFITTVSESINPLSPFSVPALWLWGFEMGLEEILWFLLSNSSFTSSSPLCPLVLSQRKTRNTYIALLRAELECLSCEGCEYIPSSLIALWSSNQFSQNSCWYCMQQDLWVLLVQESRRSQGSRIQSLHSMDGPRPWFKCVKVGFVVYTSESWKRKVMDVSISTLITALWKLPLNTQHALPNEKVDSN